MESQLEQLKQLVLKGGFDEDSKAQVKAYEERLQKLAAAEKIKDLPPIREFIAYMEREIDRCETLLKSDETLTDVQRTKLFAIIQVSEKYTRLFNGSGLRNLEQSIKKALDVARSH
jgi:Spy/CpxP family protein refolding chaperone